MNIHLPRDDAVSPVIGVVLLFAISITLAAVTAGVVVAGDDALVTTAPQATFDFDYTPGGTAGEDITDSGDSGSLTVTHEGGDNVNASAVEFRASPGGTATGGDLSWSGEVTAGDSTTATVDADTTVRVVYVGNGGRSTTMASWDGPAA